VPISLALATFGGAAVASSAPTRLPIVPALIALKGLEGVVATVMPPRATICLLINEGCPGPLYTPIFFSSPASHNPYLISKAAHWSHGSLHVNAIRYRRCHAVAALKLGTVVDRSAIMLSRCRDVLVERPDLIIRERGEPAIN